MAAAPPFGRPLAPKEVRAAAAQAGRMTLISYGEERPLCTEKEEDCWSRNRRAHFLVKPR